MTPLWIYTRTTDTARRVYAAEADKEGRAGADAGRRVDSFVVEADDEAAAVSLAREWIAAEDDVGDMALAYRTVRGRSYAYLTRL